MDAEGPPDGSDRTSPLRKPGELLGEGLELVHTREPRQDRASAGYGGSAAVVLDVLGSEALASSRSRRLSSASSDVRARAVRWPSRSVTRPAVCGRRAHSLERRTALVVDQHEDHLIGPVAQAREVTRVWSSSDLPEPVVPPTSTWGPSRRRSTV